MLSYLSKKFNYYITVIQKSSVFLVHGQKYHRFFSHSGMAICNPSAGCVPFMLPIYFNGFYTFAW
jgi:hypothetical protein